MILNNKVKDIGYNSYNEYLKSEYWDKFKKQIENCTPKVCWVCRATEAIQLHYFLTTKGLLDGVRPSNLAINLGFVTIDGDNYSWSIRKHVQLLRPIKSVKFVEKRAIPASK